MRRRLMGQKQSSKAQKPSVPSLSAPPDLPLQQQPILLSGQRNPPTAASRRSLTSVVAADERESDYSSLMAGDKYATIGGGAFKAVKWPSLVGAGTERQNDGNGGDPSRAKALNGGGSHAHCQRQQLGRPRSMGVAQMGVQCAGGTDAFPATAPSGPSPFMVCATPALAQTDPSSSIFQHSHQQTNRNSVGSSHSSQTSSGFESAKSSSSSHQLAQSASSGSCTSSSALRSTPLANSGGSPADPASPSSRLSSAGSSTQGRSSAYFSLSDGLDCSNVGPGGTLTSGRRSKGQQSRAKAQCSRVNIGEMMAKGIPESEIFAEWLQRLCLSEYLALFLSQGYDLPTLARVSPEDLATLGVTKPEDRKRLIQDIQCWRNVRDQWPAHIAQEGSLRDWLAAIGLKQYVEQFESQGYLSVGELEQLEAEDLEDIGVHKLGHIKRIWLALKKLRQSRMADHQPAGPTGLAAPPAAAPLDFSAATLRPCELTALRPSCSSSSATGGNLRRHSQPQEVAQRIAGGGGEAGRTNREVVTVQFRNSSFGVEEADKGPPRLNLYRTSQIIAQLPREPPPELGDDEEEGPIGMGVLGHIPPPPAPMPLSPALPFSSRPSAFFASLSQPATPRNVQRLFPMSDHPLMLASTNSPTATFLKNGGSRGRLDLMMHDLSGELNAICTGRR